MNSFRTNYPTVVRLFRWFFSWRFLRRALLSIVVVVTLIVAYFTEEKIRGKWEWENFQHELEAQGQPIHLSQVIPPQVPDDQNFAMTPLFKPINYNNREDESFEEFEKKDAYNRELSTRLSWPAPGGVNKIGRDAEMPPIGDLFLGKTIDLNKWEKFFGNRDILQALHELDPVLDEISLASRRPYSRFPVHYEAGFAMLLPHLNYLIQLGYIYEVRSLAELAQGDTNKAFDDAVTIFQLSNALQSDIALVSTLTSANIARGGLQVIWEGLLAHRWSDEQLARFQNELQKHDLIALGRRNIYAESIMVNESLGPAVDQPGMLRVLIGSNVSQAAKQIVALSGSNIFGFPKGWLYQNMLANDHYVQETISAYDVANRRIDARKLDASEVSVNQMRTTPNIVLFKLIAHALALFSEQIARVQTGIDEANIACAIERYRLANGKLPESLEVFAPKFIAKVPNDIISGKSLIYRRTGDNNFVLYSLGWNEQDHGGRDIEGILGGDWVWTYPAK